jgi:hypothetical protein
MGRRSALGLIGGLAALAAAGAWLAPPIPQDPAYHRLADSRPWLGIPNALNVLSNVGFILVGALGLAFVMGPGRRGPAFREPGNARLAWDRLPLAITLMGLLAATIAERIGVKAGLRLLGPLVLLAAGSVVYWHWTELRGAGDLRPYALVQFYPIVAVPLMLWWLPPRYSRGGELLAAAATYAAAKAPELLDGWVLSVTHVVSGYTLKHLLAALAGYWVLRMLRHRRAA